MKLVFQKQVIEISDESSADEIIEKINELLKIGYYFSHFIADGNEVFEDHEQFLTLHADEIESLEIIAKTVKEFTNDLLLSTEEYTERANPFLDSLSMEFYNNPTPETWEQFAQLMEGLQWLNGVIELLQNQDEKVSNWEAYADISFTLQEELANLEEAVENEDFVLIGDIIQYEIAPNFDALREAAKLTIDTEGMRPHLN